MGGKSILLIIACFFLLIGILLFGFVDTIDGAIHDGDVNTYYNATILSAEQEMYEDNFLIIQIPYYVTNVSVQYSDGTKDSYGIETYRNITPGSTTTIYEYKDKHAVDREDLFKHRKLRHTGLAFIIISLGVVITIVAPRRRRFFA